MSAHPVPRAIGVSLPAHTRTKSESELIRDVEAAAQHLRALMADAVRRGLVVQTSCRQVPIRYVQGGILLDAPVVGLQVMKAVPLERRSAVA